MPKLSGNYRRYTNPEDMLPISVDEALDELTGAESVESEATRTRDRWLTEATSSTFTMRASAPFRRGWPK